LGDNFRAREETNPAPPNTGGKKKTNSLGHQGRFVGGKND